MSTTPTTRKTAAKSPVRQPNKATHPRPGAVPSPEMINIFEEALVREGGTAARQRSASASTARLFVKAWVNNVAYEKNVWLDVDLLGRTGQPVQSKRLTLGYAEAAGGSGDFFLVDAPVPPPSSPTRGGPAELLEYHLYYEVGGKVFTDGIPHRHQLRPAPAAKNGRK